MDSSKVHGYDLRSEVSPSLALIFIVITHTTVFVWRAKYRLVILTMHIDDILLIEIDLAGLVETNKYLKRYFVTKDMGKDQILSWD